MADLSNWYWTIGGDTSQVWSSKKAGYVPVTDADYVAWYVSGRPPDLATMRELEQILSEQYPRGSLNTYCAYVRWQKEQGGITLSSGIPIETDDRAQAKITGVYSAQRVNPAVTTPWHAADGSIHDLTAAEMDAMHVELLTHINNCFTISKDVLAQIAAGTITTHDQIDAAFAGAMTQANKNWLQAK